MSDIYRDDWKHDGEEKMLEDFNITADSLAPYKVLLAAYTYENYSGEAFVLLRRKEDGKFFEVNGSHCSCYGLEDQWSPEEIEPEALRMRRPDACAGYKNECVGLISFYEKEGRDA